VVSGRTRACFGVTEPDAGLDTSRIKTRAVRQGDRYVVQGQKIWTSTAQVADKIVLLARTTPIEECARPTDGLSLFYADLDRRHVQITEIPKMGRHAVDSNQLFLDGLEIPADCRIGAEGQGFRYILDSLNPERILNAAEAIGIGRRALGKAARYAAEREVFGRPIGMNQSIQHPLAECWSELCAAELTVLPAAPLPMQPSILLRTRPSMPPTEPCAHTVEWAMQPSSTSNAISARWSPPNWRQSRAK
jgi:acyl-CoA dehydrogenase